MDICIRVAVTLSQQKSCLSWKINACRVGPIGSTTGTTQLQALQSLETKLSKTSCSIMPQLLNSTPKRLYQHSCMRKGEDVEGITREVFSLFWRKCAPRFFEEITAFRTRGDTVCTSERFKLLGQIASHGFVLRNFSNPDCPISTHWYFTGKKIIFQIG